MRKFSIILLCLTLLLSLQPIVKPSAAGDTAMIITDSLNVREGPGLSYKVMKKAQEGESFPLVKEDGDWIQVEISSGKYGWVASWLVSKKQLNNGNVVSSQNGKITTNNLRLRSGAGTNFEVLGALNKGDKVQIINTKDNWYEVKTTFGKGWVSKDYVQLEEGQTAAQKLGEISATSLNVRSSPSEQSKIVGKLSKGKQITILSEQNGWMEITFNNQKAWISSEFVKNISEPKEQVETKAPTKPSGATGTVTVASLNVRDSGSLDGKVIGTIRKGENYKILEEGNNWSKIELQSGKFGWVASWYLEKSKSSDSTSSSNNTINNKVTITNDGTNIRSEPSLNSQVIERANSGTTYEVVTLKNDWYEVRLSNGKSGFVAGWIVSGNGKTSQVDNPVATPGLKGKKIMVDPGHGGKDNGTTGAKGTLEKHLTLKTGQLLYNKLKARGANVTLTRSNDQYHSLGTRVSMSHYQNVDAFISIHYDSVNNQSVRGITSYFYHTNQRELASTVHQSIINQTGMNDRGFRFGDYHVIRENRQKAILLELGYLSNPTEELLLNTSQYQEQVTNGILKGLSDYFN